MKTEGPADEAGWSPCKITLGCMFVYASLLGCCDQVMPANFKSLEHDLKLGPTSLGTLTFVNRVAVALCCPIWGVLIDCAHSKSPMVITAVLCGISAIVLSLTSSLSTLSVLMAINGIGMSCVGPLTQRITSDEVSVDKRGQIFGYMYSLQSFGRMAGLFLASLCTMDFFLPLGGWRFSFVLIGVPLLLLVAFAIVYFPSQTRRADLQGARGFNLKLPPAKILKNKSLYIMLFQGTLAGIPKSALSFITMWFQYCGLSNFAASFMTMASWIAAMAIAPCVGHVGDFFYRRSPQHGRTLMAQIAILTRTTLMTIVLLVIPKRADSFPWYLTLATLIGFMAGWPGVGANRPILTEIVEPEYRATVYSMVSQCPR
eukprot:GHVU01040649.1.p1 GENE.GHVU01040649.1~~GHVU01040649.1.p1  ORF type:complete len:389 (+),score=15.35 GHVU01040649.1:53-1168(+)